MEKDLNIYHTGATVVGDPQTNPNASLGGNRAGTKVTSLNVSAPVNITGVVVDEISSNCGAGTAQLSFTSAGSLLAFTAPGDTQGASVDVSVDGTYEVYSADSLKYAIVTVTSASLPVADASDNITLTAVLNNLFDSVGSGEASAGNTEYRAVMIKNDSAYTMSAVAVFISANTPFVDDSIEIATETAVADTIQSIASETTAPTGLTFSTADGEVNAISIGTLSAGSACGLWLKRVVTPTTGRYPNNSFAITVKADTV